MWTVRSIQAHCKEVRCKEHTEPYETIAAAALVQNPILSDDSCRKGQASATLRSHNNQFTDPQIFQKTYNSSSGGSCPRTSDGHRQEEICAVQKLVCEIVP